MRKILLLAIPSAAMVFLACGSGEPTMLAEPSASAPAASDEASSDDTTMSAGSCVEQYSLEALKNRDYAFEGTIVSIDPDPADGPDRVMFDVGTWFTGGQGTTATKQAYGFGGGMTSAGGSSHAVGERLLVAGDDKFVWECGFTQPYDASVAADWKEALR
jgi:hypothetical protein